jgi:probable O-glycosylation ligase (exosortase A-associated)
MRDIALATFLLGSLPFILWRPVLGVFLWVWVSVMSPHRLTYGFAYDFPFAQLIAIATLIGLVVSRQPKRLPVTPVTATLFALLVWMSVTTLFAIDTAESLPVWEKVMKVQLMIFVTAALLHSRQHVQILIWIIAASVAFYAVKGGLFTLRVGGEQRVWGPWGSYIEDNNSLALATVMMIPLLRYLHLQATHRWIRHGLLAAMLLSGLSALGSQSRGALLAIAAMLAFMWLKSRAKVGTGIALLVLFSVGVAFMPDKWDTRMRSIENYEEDTSAQGRFNAWMNAFHLAQDRPLGGGFAIYTPEVFARYAPDPTDVHSAHSIYFQVLGEHGFVGLLLFLLLWLLVWRDASWIDRRARTQEGWQWASDLARMVQVALVGYGVGGAFLNLAYYDVPYNLIVALVVTRILVERQIQSAAEAAPTTSAADGVRPDPPISGVNSLKAPRS